MPTKLPKVITESGRSGAMNTLAEGEYSMRRTPAHLHPRWPSTTSTTLRQGRQGDYEAVILEEAVALEDPHDLELLAGDLHVVPGRFAQVQGEDATQHRHFRLAILGTEGPPLDH